MTNKGFSIKEISDNYGFSRMMLQRYEKYDLIKPTGKNKYGHLYYDEEMLNRILLIRFLQGCYFLLPEIKEIMTLSNEEVRKILDKRVKELDFRLERINDQKERVKLIQKALLKDDKDTVIRIIKEAYKRRKEDVL
ncbi:MAG: MerR family transcriptional regulator [Erysipelotrichaceae bacterium]|nr:MerR family transcriptional regulator [Erysipelotrichaceae bacterium]